MLSLHNVKDRFFTTATAIILSLAACSAEAPTRGLPMATLLHSPSVQLGVVSAHHHPRTQTSMNERRNWEGRPAVQRQSSLSSNREGNGVGASRSGSLTPSIEPMPIARDLLISEVMTDPLLLDDAVGEYVELVYLGAEPASLKDVLLRLPDGRDVRLDAGESGLSTKPRKRRPRALLPRERDRKGRTGVEDATLRPASFEDSVRPGDVVVVRSTRRRRLRLPNRAGRLELHVGHDVLDVMQWTAKWPWPKHRSGRALCRKSATHDGRLGRSWRRCRTSLRGVERGSPGVLSQTCGWLRTRNVLLERCKPR